MSTNKQSGAVSLFVVVFFMLLITVVTVSFIRLMIADQQQATNNDLSQSALDSAMAGVEDAKRALLQYQQDCSISPGNCINASNALSGINGEGAACNVALQKVIGNGSATTGEIQVQQSLDDSDKALNQAYTCVKIKLETPNYIGNLAANQSQLVPLISKQPFDRVIVEWFSNEDVSSTGGATAIDLEPVASSQPIYTKGQWPVNRPSLMRAQLIQFADTFTLSNFDTVSGAQSNGATMFLYPSSRQNVGALNFTDYDQRKPDAATNPLPKEAGRAPTPVSCQPNLNSTEYACTAELVLPEAIGAASPTQRTAFLRLVAFYNPSKFKVTLSNGPFNPANPNASLAKFKDVQPEIDSTGRANDVFKRVISNVNLYDTSFPYPEATIDVTGDFCKDFAVTDTRYIAGSTTCKP